MNTINFWTQFHPVQGRISIPNFHLIASFAHTHILFSFLLSLPPWPVIVQLSNVFFFKIQCFQVPKWFRFKAAGVVYWYMNQTWNNLNPWNFKSLARQVTEVDCIVFSAEVDAMISHLQHAALWKWYVLLHPTVISSLFAIVILVWNVLCPLMPSFLLSTGCHSMSNRSQIEFLKFQTWWIRSQGRDMCVFKNLFLAFLCSTRIEEQVRNFVCK